MVITGPLLCCLILATGGQHDFTIKSSTLRGCRDGCVAGHIWNKSNDVKFLKENIIVNCDFLVAFDRGFCLFVMAF